MRELLEKTLAVNEIDIKRGLRTTAAAALIGAGAAGVGYKKGLSQRPVEKPVATSKIDEPVEWQTVEMRVTAYCPCPKCTGTGSPGITASGYEIQPGDAFVAADKRYPFGTKMIIPGYNDDQPVEVLDRGGAIKGDRIDVFFPTHDEALEWGVKNLSVKIQN